MAKGYIFSRMRKKHITQKQIDALKQIIGLFGNQNALATKLGIKQSSISKWLSRQIPANQVIKLEKLSKGKVTRYDLRPDLYPKEKK